MTTPFSIFTALVRSLLITVAAAQPIVPCVGLPGCPGFAGNAATNILFTHTIPVIIEQLLNIAAAAAVLFVVVAGGQMLIAQGDESKVTNAKKGTAAALGGLAVALASKTIITVVATPGQYLQGNSDPTRLIYGNVIPTLVKLILVVLNVAFLIVIMIAGFRMVIARGAEDEFKKSKEIVTWAIVGAIVINGARALVLGILNLNL